MLCWSKLTISLAQAIVKAQAKVEVRAGKTRASLEEAKDSMQVDVLQSNSRLTLVARTRQHQLVPHSSTVRYSRRDVTVKR